MKIRLIGAALLLLGVLPVVTPASAAGSAEFRSDHKRYAQGKVVKITLTNKTGRAVTMEPEWEIQNLDTAGTFAMYIWRDDELRVRPGESRTWAWDQHGSCGGACQNVWEGLPADAARYAAVATVDGATLATHFTIGTYFTLGFDCCPGDGFTVFVARQDDVDAMREEANAEDKTKLVMSIVRLGRRGYNADWSYTMDPREIEVAEVAIEVCDAAPRYVERHRRQWKGDFWCPWSSYVAREGR